MGDLDPLSLLRFQILKNKGDIKYLGIKTEDIKKFSLEQSLIKMESRELTLLNRLNKNTKKELKEEIKFLKKGYKIEIESLREKIREYILSKIINSNQ